MSCGRLQMPLLSIDHRPQEYAVGCLTACAQMALAHLGSTQSQRQLNRLLGLTSLGTPQSRIKRFCKIFSTFSESPYLSFPTHDTSLPLPHYKVLESCIKPGQSFSVESNKTGMIAAV